MELIATIRYSVMDRKLLYSGELVANHVPMQGAHMDVMEQVDRLNTAHKAIESVIEEINNRLGHDVESED